MTDSSHIIDLKLGRRVIIGLLYIINHDKYLEYNRNGFMKYVPYTLLPSIKPKIIDNIIRKDDIIGKVAGVNIKPIEFSCEKELGEYIMGIKKIGMKDLSGMYLEEAEYIPKEAIKHIEGKLGMKISQDKNIKINHIPLVIKKIYNLLDDDLQGKEVLVISKDKETTKKVVKGISKDIKFITTLGCNPEENEEIYEYILEETGLSLFHSSDIDKILGRYSIIINLADDFKLETSKIKRNAIVFDFSHGNIFKPKENNNNAFQSITDFGFDLQDLYLDKNKWLDDKVNSELYGILNGNLPGEIRYVCLENNYYSIKAYINSFIKIRGKL